VFLPPGAVHIRFRCGAVYGKMEAIVRSEYTATPWWTWSCTSSTAWPPRRARYWRRWDQTAPRSRTRTPVHRSGWLEVDELYLRKQDVRINITRFAPMLAQAFDHLRGQ
jgi:hypothetical protein